MISLRFWELDIDYKHVVLGGHHDEVRPTR